MTVSSYQPANRMPTDQGIKTPGATFTSLLDRWPDMAEVARDLGLSYFTVAAWARRDSVPETYWDALSTSAATRNIPGATYDDFRRVAADRSAARLRKRHHLAAPAAGAAAKAINPTRSSSLGNLDTNETSAQVAQQSALPAPSAKRRKPHGE